VRKRTPAPTVGGRTGSRRTRRIACRWRSFRSLAFVVLPLAAGTGPKVWAQPCECADVRLSNPRLSARLEGAFERSFGGFEPGTTVAVLIEGTGLWTSSRGLADREVGTEMTPGHHFRIASNTKPLVAALIHQLEQEEMLALDDLVERWEPGYFDGHGIRLRHLVGHTSGIPDYLSAPVSIWFWGLARQRPIEMREIVEKAAAESLLFPPGSGWTYSNTNYTLLGMIIERVTGRPWHLELRDRILDPLGMDSTFTEGPEEIPGPLARGYLGPGDVTDVLYHPNGMSDGDVVSTSADLACWVSRLFGGSVVDDQHLSQMRNGLGLFFWPTVLGPSYWHGGSWLGHESSMIYYPEARLAVAGFVNRTPTGDIYDALSEIAVVAAPEPPQERLLATALATLALLSCQATTTSRRRLRT
jgi:D-alanyl-D-alanine carboxypeptidase